ncbi:MAG: MATE family efflux transporter [Lachnospiraceae bacterium]|nr:MATE family efflux transporter [Lachnospiraceae bacterium]
MRGLLKLPEGAPFSNKEIFLFLLPIWGEQMMLSALSMIDTLMVSQLPNNNIILAAVANVSRIDLLFKQIFVALAAGVGIYISQYLGAQKPEQAKKVLKMGVITIFSGILILVFVMELFKGGILNMLYGESEPAVMEQCLTYYSITILSYPFVALFNCGTASFRSIGKSKLTMVASVIMLSINIGLKYIFLFVIPMGIVGVGLSLLMAYAIMSLVLMGLLSKKEEVVYFEGIFKKDWDLGLLGRVFHVALPTGIENGMFQLGALILQTLVVSLGTESINANHLTTTLSPLVYGVGVAFTLGSVPFISRMMGANQVDWAEALAKHMLKLDRISLAITAAIAIPLVPLILPLFRMTDYVNGLTMQAITLYFAAMPFFYPSSFCLPAMLRGTGDTAFTMYVSVATMFCFRIGFAYLLVKAFHVGFIAIWIAMVSDWVIRGIAFRARFKQGKWKTLHLVES